MLKTGEDLVVGQRVAEVGAVEVLDLLLDCEVGEEVRVKKVRSPLSTQNTAFL